MNEIVTRRSAKLLLRMRGRAAASLSERATSLTIVREWIGDDVAAKWRSLKLVISASASERPTGRIGQHFVSHQGRQKNKKQGVYANPL